MQLFHIALSEDQPDGSLPAPFRFDHDVVLRARYPSLLGSDLSQVNPRPVFFVTGPCYAIVFYLLGSTVYTVWANQEPVAQR